MSDDTSDGDGTGSGSGSGPDTGRSIQAAVYRDGLFGVRPKVPIAPDALRDAARDAMSEIAWAYVEGAAGLEQTTAANRQAFERWRIVPRMLRDTSRRDLGIELLGRRYPAPILLCPIGVLELAHRQGDLAVARAAAARGVPMTVSTQASHPMERIADTMGDAPRWYQLYWSNNDDLMASLVSRAEQSGYSAIVVTLDTHVLGWRPRDLDIAYLPFARGLGLAQYTSDPVFSGLVDRRVEERQASPNRRPTLEAIRSLFSIARRYPGSTLGNLRSPRPRAAVETFLEVFSRPTLTWDDLDLLRERTELPIVLKGIQHDEDARRAVDAGVDAIVVSNHGGRQVDGATGSLDALPGIVAVVDGRVPIVFDSGVRCGADVFKALALGATAVGIGRPYVYGLAIAGEEGVRTVVESFLAELDLTMALTGCRSIEEIRPDLVVRQ